MVTGGDTEKLKGWTIYDFFFEFDLLVEKLEKEAKKSEIEARKKHR